MVVRCVISIAFTDGEQMYDDDYEVGGVATRGMNGSFSIRDVVISGPGSLLSESRSIPECLPSSWYLEAEDALADKAAEDFFNGDSDDQYYQEEDR